LHLIHLLLAFSILPAGALRRSAREEYSCPNKEEAVDRRGSNESEVKKKMEVPSSVPRFVRLSPPFSPRKSH